MKQLFSFFAFVALIGACLSSCGGGKADANAKANAVDTTLVALGEPVAKDFTKKPCYFGDTIYRYDGKTVVVKSGGEDLEPTTDYFYEIVTYDGKTPKKRSLVLGHEKLYADGSTLKVAVGVDTVRYDLKNLPDTLDPVKALRPKNLVEHKYEHKWALTDSSVVCTFEFLAYLPENHPEWLDLFINTLMNADELEDYDYAEYKAYRDKCNKENPDVHFLTLEEMVEAHAMQDEQSYKEHFADEEETTSPFLKCDYLFEASPVWMSADGKYVTYRFYIYNYFGGMHGLYEDFYLTFDNQTGDVLGYKEIIGESNFPEAIEQLGAQLTAHKSIGREITMTFSPDLDYIESYSSNTFKEIYDDTYYPRPAITNEGIVFSYQPYEKSFFGDGVLHFLIPYKQ